MYQIRNRLRNSMLLAAAMCCVASAGVAHAAIIYVDDSAGGVGDGSSWHDAFTRLRPALLLAKSGDEVRVGQGVYCPANVGQSRDLSFVVPAGASLVGGFAGDGAVDPDSYDPETFFTVLTGDINGDDGADFANYADNCRHVVTIIAGGRSTILRGVTVSGGNADGASDGSPLGSAGAGVAVRDNAAPSILECLIELNQAALAGAAIHAGGENPLLRRCVIQNNRTTQPLSQGGAVVLGSGSRVERCGFFSNSTGRSGGALVGSGIDFTNSDFEDNSAGEFGGAVVGNDMTFTDCTFTGNSARHGGAMRCANVSLTNCTFDDNTAERRGGAILAAGALLIEDCVFTLNNALSGAAIDVRGAFSANNCLFDRNSTGNNGLDGGAIAMRGVSDLVNCTFLANFAGRVGGAISLDEGAASAVNCLFAGNRARRVGGAIHNDGSAFELANCALTGNLCDEIGGQHGGALHNRNGGLLRVSNSLLWANSAGGGHTQRDQLVNEGGTLVIAHTLLQGWNGALGGVGNGGADPQFADIAGPDHIFGTSDDDLHLLPGSPARDAGDNSLLPRDLLDVDHDGNRNEKTPLDLLGNHRTHGGTIDIGPIEFGSSPP